VSEHDFTPLGATTSILGDPRVSQETCSHFGFGACGVDPSDESEVAVAHYQWSYARDWLRHPHSTA